MVAAFMTIVGYSLNDTIVIFDRIGVTSAPQSGDCTLIDRSLNVTLRRTLMTSGTTLAALLPLLLWGGASIFGLSLVMVIGVIVGTLSSLFIAAPALLLFSDPSS